MGRRTAAVSSSAAADQDVLYRPDSGNQCRVQRNSSTPRITSLRTAAFLQLAIRAEPSAVRRITDELGSPSKMPAPMRHGPESSAAARLEMAALPQSSMAASIPGNDWNDRLCFLLPAPGAGDARTDQYWMRFRRASNCRYQKSARLMTEAFRNGPWLRAAHYGDSRSGAPPTARVDLVFSSDLPPRRTPEVSC